MANSPYSPLIELTRGPLVESVHLGALAVVDSSGALVASCGDPGLVANLRSSSKPFQALPLFEQGGAETFNLTDREIALTCASHSGSDEHISVLLQLQAKVGVLEINLQCGVHPSSDEVTVKAMLARGEEPTSNRHNCSGKHTGMMAQAVLQGEPIDNYLSADHPVQRNILQIFAEITGESPQDVLIGIDGCSAPTFAVPLRSAALAFARLADPTGLPEKRAQALRRIYHAMTTNPDMVAGTGQFDTLLMVVGEGKVVSKGGAEGYQAIGVQAGALGPGSPALGITYKVIDGDTQGRARPVIGVAVLQQLGVLDEAQVQKLKKFAPRPIYNWRKLEIGEIRPAFKLEFAPGWLERA
jgi:L-asparaginase II